MELDWTTVVLEVVNFLVLVWLLKRFLYRPVLAVVEKRRLGIEEMLTEAKEREESAEALRTRYETRLSRWAQEKASAKTELDSELREQRERAQEELVASLSAERQRLMTVEAREASEVDRHRRREALRDGAAFAARLLQDLADEGLEARIVDLVCAELMALPADRRAALRGAPTDTVRVQSAFLLDEGARRRIIDALAYALAAKPTPTFDESRDLIAGVRITAGDWMLSASLQDELSFFVEQWCDDD